MLEHCDCEGAASLLTLSSQFSVDVGFAKWEELRRRPGVFKPCFLFLQQNFAKSPPHGGTLILATHSHASIQGLPGTIAALL